MSNLAKAMEQALEGSEETKKALSKRESAFNAKEKVKQDREARKRARLKTYLLKRLSRIEKNIVACEKEFESYSAALTKFVSVLDKAPYTTPSKQGEKSPLTMKISSYGQGATLMRFLRDNTDVILDGTIDRDEKKRARLIQASRPRATDQVPHLSRAIDERCIDSALNKLFQEQVFECSFELDEKQAEKAQKITPQFAKRITVSIAVTPATSTPGLSISATHKVWKHNNNANRLNDRSFAHALTYVHDWALQAFYNDTESLTRAWTDMQADQALRESHMSLYGHTRYCDRKEDDLKGRQKDMEERLTFWRDRVEKQKPIIYKG